MNSLETENIPETAPLEAHDQSNSESNCDQQESGVLKVIQEGTQIRLENVAHWGKDKGYRDAAGNHYDPQTYQKI